MEQALFEPGRVGFFLLYDLPGRRQSLLETLLTCSLALRGYPVMVVDLDHDGFASRQKMGLCQRTARAMEEKVL